MIKLFFLFTLCFVIFSCASNTAIKNPVVAKKVIEVKKPVIEVPVISVSHKDIGYSELEKAISLGDDDKIKEASAQVLQINPKDLMALNALAMCYYRKQQFGAAELLLNKALVIQPKSLAVYNNLGLVELTKKNKREAMYMFRKALELDSKYYVAAVNASAVYGSEKDYKKVIFSLEKIFDNDKIQVDSLNNYAIALNAVGKHAESADVFKKILKASPENKSAMLNYSILLIEKQGKHKQGLDLIERLKFVGADNESRQVIKNLENKAKAGLK